MSVKITRSKIFSLEEIQKLAYCPQFLDNRLFVKFDDAVSTLHNLLSWLEQNCHNKVIIDRQPHHVTLYFQDALDLQNFASNYQSVV